MVDPDSNRVSRAPPYLGTAPWSPISFAYAAFTLFRAPFQTLPLNIGFLTNSTGHPRAALQHPTKGFRLLRVRSPLLAQSLLISLPALLRWFTSRSIAPPQYLLPARGVCLTTYGLPHSAICGSQDVCSSPQLFAAYRGLLRRTAPRHPPQTYSRLTIFSFPRLKLPTAPALKPSSLPYIFKEHKAVEKVIDF